MSISDYARELLIDKIVSLELDPGSAIIEREILASLSLGRTPVREALYQLVGLGLVCRTSHVGMYVCEVTDQSMREIYELRATMDGSIAEIAARRASSQDADLLAAAARDIEQAYEAYDLRRFTEAGRVFYMALAKITDNLHIVELMPRMYYVDCRLTWLANRHMGDWKALGRGMVETASSLARAIAYKLPIEAKLLAGLHVERRYTYLQSEVSLGSGSAAYRRQA